MSLEMPIQNHFFDKLTDDDTNPTPVVQHSKQMSSQIPPTASLILQNGGITTLQPVIVGSNGEIGYIAYPDSGMSSMISGNSDPGTF